MDGDYLRKNEDYSCNNEDYLRKNGESRLILVAYYREQEWIFSYLCSPKGLVDPRLPKTPFGTSQMQTRVVLL